MQIVGWIIRTGSSGAVRYWKVGKTSPERAAGIASAAAGGCVATAISKIGAAAISPRFTVPAGVATEIWKRNLSGSSEGQVTFDTVFEEEQHYIDGCYRIGNGDWQVYFFTHWKDGHLWTGASVIRSDVTFSSGVGGVDGVLSVRTILNKREIIKILAEITKVDRWTEIEGPNSLVLK